MATTAFINTKYTTLAANGNTATETINGGVVEVDVYVQDSPTWGSGTLKLQGSPDGGTTWIDLPATSSWTSGGGRLTTAPIVAVGCTAFRLNLAGATSPSITPQLVVRRIDHRQFVRFDFTADATSATFSSSALPDTFGVYEYGTFGSGTVKLQVSPDNGTTWYTMHSKSANAYTKEANLREVLYRFVLSGSTSPALTCLVA